MISETAIVGIEVIVSQSAKVWNYAQIRDFAIIGENVVIGQGAYVGEGVKIDDNCKIQNYALLYEPATLEQGVFIGPGVIFTNDKNPKAINPDISLKKFDDWKKVGTYVKEGASIGAGSICIAPIVIGRWSMIAAGSIVTKDVADFALMMGSPAQQFGWVGRAGHKLIKAKRNSNIYSCPLTGEKYVQKNKNLLEEFK